MMYKEKKNGNSVFPTLDRASKIATGEHGGTDNKVFTKDPRKAAKIATGYD